MAKASVTNIKPSLKKRDAKLNREAAEFERTWLALSEPRRMDVYRSIMAATRAQRKRILRGETAQILRLVKGAGHG